MRKCSIVVLASALAIISLIASMASPDAAPAQQGQQVPDIRDPSIHAELLEGDWEPSGVVQGHLNVREPYHFYSFKNNATLANRFKDVLVDAKIKGFKTIGYGWTTETYVRFMGGKEVGRSTEKYPYALLGSDRGIVLQLTNHGTEEEPRWREQCLAVFCGEKPESDLLLIRAGLRSRAVAFQRAMVRQPIAKEK